MKEINKPNERNFWKIESGGVFHSGVTEPNQVTTSGYDLEASNDAGNILPELPESGELTQGEIYAYNGGMVRIEQTHERTIYPPQLTPNLITFYRKEVGDLEWIINENIEVGDIRIFEGNKYEAIQSHTSLENWKPDETPTLWELVTDEISVWVQPTGGHDAYNIGDKVYYPTANDDIYESTIDGNVWSPDVTPQFWNLVL